MAPALRIVKPTTPFDVEGFLRSVPVGTTIATFRPGETIFSQCDAAGSVIYLQDGAVKLAVLSRTGNEAVVAMLEAGAFFGESALSDRPVRHQMATATTATTVLIIPTQQMIDLLHEHREFSDHFIAHLLARNGRIQEDVVDLLLNSSEKRLARALLLLAHYGTPGKTHRAPLRLSQQTLAAMVGTTRSRVNAFMNRFRKLGYVEYTDGLRVNDSLASVILRDERVGPRPLKVG